jgi:hypothetical protein
MEAWIRALTARIARSLPRWRVLVFLLDLVNPLRNPSILVAVVLTFIEEVGELDSVGRIAVGVLLNLLIVRIFVRLVTLAALGCLLLFYTLRDHLLADMGGMQGERSMDSYTFTYCDVLFRVFFGYPYRYQMYYGIQAERGGELAYGRVRYAKLDLSAVQVECLEFFEGAAWLREVFANPADGSWAVTPEVDFFQGLSAWMLADYRRRISDLIEEIEAGDAPPPDFRVLWYYELCRVCEIDPREEPTPRELAAAFRLLEAHASFEVREHAARERRQAKLLRRAQELGRWNAWVSEHLHTLEKTSVFPLEVLHSAGPPLTFATSRYDLAVSYESICLAGGEGVGYLETVAENTFAYVPRPVAQRWYRERWQRERGSASALYVLNGILTSGGKAIEGGDYLSWIFAHEGEDALVTLARSQAPLTVSWQQVHRMAVASKYYRIPVSVLLEGEHYVGYGVPGLSYRNGTPSQMLWQNKADGRMQRLQGWVFFGDEEAAPWPDEGDIAAYRLEWHYQYTGLPAGFG